MYTYIEIYSYIRIPQLERGGGAETFYIGSQYHRAGIVMASRIGRVVDDKAFMHPSPTLNLPLLE